MTDDASPHPARRRPRIAASLAALEAMSDGAREARAVAPLDRPSVGRLAQ